MYQATELQVDCKTKIQKVLVTLNLLTTRGLALLTTTVHKHSVAYARDFEL